MMHSPQLRAAALGSMLLCALLVGSGVCQNVDTAQPILRSVAGNVRDYFGYTLALHQTASNPGNLQDAISGARIIVSAPKATAAPGGPGEERTGVVYACPVDSGTCAGLPGKLFDQAPNDMGENKTDQFLGGSMASNGDRFIVCAHRYTSVIRANNRDNPFPLGKCFFSDRSLQSFEEYQPCSTQTGQLRTGSIGVCQAGTSSTIVPSGGSFAYGLGAPGVGSWAGAVIRRNQNGGTNIQSTSTSSERNSYQGYAIVGGRFIDRNRLDFATSVPRRNSYFGTVNLVMNSNNLQFTSQPLMGLQMGEYYGFSLLAADLNGDGFDELLVSAPLFRANSTEPETGRVYIYRNTGGNLEFVRTIEGRTRYSRFGYAMANLGDISGDGLDDVAISAPFTETGNTEPGTVFIYHSTPNLLLTSEPRQIIRGTDLSLMSGLSGLRGFGTSLASGVDVDLNSYNDLLVGSFLSQQAFLLRTRPLARVQTSVSAVPQIVDVNNRTRLECRLNNQPMSCFTVTACVTYSGTGLTDTLSLNFTLMADTQNVERRIIFNNGETTTSRSVTADLNVQLCQDFTAYIRNDMLNDVFNPFIMEVRIDTPVRTVSPGNGNESPQSLSDFPVVSQFGASQVQVETLKECDGGVCIPDLRISIADPRIMSSDRTPLDSIVAGFTSTIELDVIVENPREDAFQASLTFDLPSNTLELVNVFNQTNNGEVSLRCDEPLPLTDDQNQPLDMIRHTCSIGNPFSGPGTIQLRVQLSPRTTIVGNEDRVSINFTVSSINPEDPATVADNSNFAIAQMEIEARADISIDDGVVTPTQISYSDNTQLSGDIPLVNVSQLGPAVDVSFLVRNSGPSRVPSINLEIMWPLSSTLTGENFYLYITSVQSSGGASVTCNSEYINQLNLVGDLGDEEGGVNPTVGMGTAGGRRKRDTVKRTLKKRQEAPAEQEVSENVTLSCNSGSPILNCVPITCTLLGLSGSSSTQIDITSRLDERFFSTNNDRYLFIPTASVSITTDAQGNTFIQPNSNQDPNEKMATAQIRVIPAARVTTVGESTPVPWWAIFVPILAAVIVITVVAVLLWVFGFFRRKKHEELKQRREELQNLQDNGVSPADGAGF